VIATARGYLGRCADYLIDTVDHLAALGIHDRSLEPLRTRVLERGRAVQAGSRRMLSALPHAAAAELVRSDFTLRSGACHA
jgi:hypothetical protein